MKIRIKEQKARQYCWQALLLAPNLFMGGCQAMMELPSRMIYKAIFHTHRMIDA